MNRLSKLLAVALMFGLGAPAIAATKGSSSSSSHKSSGASKTPATHPKTAKASGSSSKAPSKKACTTCKRDEKGKIARSPKAKDDFERQTGYPHGRPGFIVDHKVPLECGGADAPSNMQWQTAATAKAKDKTERNCRK